jgi:hypothetical protein
LRQYLCESPVHDLHLAEIPDHHVRGLQIAIDHARGVSIRHRLAHGREYREEPRLVVEGRRSVAEHLGERLALDELHGEERPAIGEGPDVIHWHHAGVLELPADLGLFDESGDQLGLTFVGFEQHLERKLSTQIYIAAADDGSHPAAGDLAE